MKSIIGFLTMSCILGLAYPQQIIKNFFPLAVGNRYIYLHTWSYFGGGGSRIETSQIFIDTIAYGKKYFWAVNFPFIDNMWIRVDSITGSLYYFDRSGTCSFYDHEKIIDSLLAGLNDSTKNCLPSSSRSKCADTSYINIFGKLRQKKRFDVNCSYPPVFNCSETRSYLDSIGIYAYYNSSSGGGGGGTVSWQLRGGIINGIVFGDTSTAIGVINLSSEIPDEYMLFQNYPNPFNPTTHFGFQIADFGLVTIKVFDVTGKEIAVLVSKELKAGTYEIDFTGSAYSSGIYFYSLIVNGAVIDTKKMILIK